MRPPDRYGMASKSTRNDIKNYLRKSMPTHGAEYNSRVGIFYIVLFAQSDIAPRT